MIRSEDIPPEVVEAAKSAYTAAIYRGNGTAREFHDAMMAAVIATLNAWPGMWVEQLYPLPIATQGVILPIPTETRDE